MKRRIALLLVLVLALSFVLASCGTKECDVHVDEDINEICDVCEAAVPYTPTYLGFEGYYNTAYENKNINAAYAAEAASKLKGFEKGAYTDDINTSRANYKLIFIKASHPDNTKSSDVKLIVVNAETKAVVTTIYQEKTELTEAEEALAPADRPKTATVFKEAYGYYDGTLGAAFIVEVTTDESGATNTYTQTLKTADGSVVATRKTSSTDPAITAYNENLFAYDGKVYSFKDGKATYKFDVGFKDIPSCEASTDKYNYDITEQAVYVYDNSYTLVSVYRLPDDCDNVDDVEFFILSDGNILVQATYLLSEDATDYDYVVEGVNYIEEAYTSKYDLKTWVYNVETKETTDLDVNYVIGSFKNKLDEDFVKTYVADKLDNVAKIYEIVDGKLDYSKYVYANVRTSDLKVLGYLAQEVLDQKGPATLFDTNRFFVEDRAGNRYVIDEKGTLLGEFSAENNFYTYNETMFAVKNGKYYDTSLKMVLDTNDNDYKYVSGRLYRETVKSKNEDGSDKTTNVYYFFYNGSYVKLDLPEKARNFVAGSNYFIYTIDEKVTVDNTEKTTTYKVVCNAKGAELAKIQTEVVSGDKTTYNDVSVVGFYGVEMIRVSSEKDYVTTYTYTLLK